MNGPESLLVRVITRALQIKQSNREVPFRACVRQARADVDASDGERCERHGRPADAVSGECLRCWGLEVSDG